MTTTTTSDQPVTRQDKARYFLTHPLKLVSNRYFVQWIASAVFVGLGIVVLSSEGAGGGTVSISYRLWSSLTIALMVFVLAVIAAIYIIIAKAWGRLFLLFVLVILIGPLTYLTMFLWAGALTKLAQVGLIQSTGALFVLMGIAALVINALLIFRIGYTGTHRAELAKLKRDIDLKEEKLNGAARNPDGSYQLLPKVNPGDEDQYVYVGAAAKAELAQASAAAAQASYNAIETTHDEAQAKAKAKSIEVDEARAKLGLAPDTEKQTEAAEKLALAETALSEANDQYNAATLTRQTADAALVAAKSDEDRQTKTQDAADAASAVIEAGERVTLRRELLESAKRAKDDADTAASMSPEATALETLVKENEDLAAVEAEQASALAAAKNVLDEKNQNVGVEGKALTTAQEDLQKAREAYEAKRAGARFNRFGWFMVTALMLVAVPFFYAFGWYALAVAGATHAVYVN